MIVQLGAIRTRDTRDIEAAFRERAAQIRQQVAERIADVIIDASPVDTGTYIMAHAAGVGALPEIETRSSHGKPRGRSRAQFQALARHNLKRSVSARAIQASTEVWFRNRALHAAQVEYLGWNGTPAYYVYARASAEAQQFIRDAVASAGGTVR
jgi:hypothetical protein